jgi:hypothetical protein
MKFIKPLPWLLLVLVAALAAVLGVIFIAGGGV